MPHLSKNVSIGLLRMLSGSLRSLSDHEAEGLARYYGRNRSSAHVQRLAYFAKCVASEFYGVTNNPEVNGEAWLISRTSRLGFKTIFDVGANVGHWAIEALERHRDATVHCFEIVPATFTELQRNLAAYGQRCVLNRFGLGEADGVVDLFVDPTNNLVSSIYVPSPSGRTKVVGELRSGSDYAQVHGLDRIDFVKIDVEGAEAMVVKGLLPQLRAGCVRLLQFEYNRGALESRFLLKDFFDLLEPLGYTLGKLYPEGVLFQPYRWELEDFMGPNYVACRHDDTELVKLLSLSAAPASM